METLIITNNPRVEKELRETEKIEFHPQAGQEEILRRARDYIHLGAKLIMHPMMGRVKPHETPYKSVFLELCEGQTDMNSVIIIEDSIRETKKLIENTYKIKYDDQLLPDLQYIDLLLLQNGIEEYRR